MDLKTLGRPKKEAKKRKRLQYSVWVSAEEKQKIDSLIEASNLPASQFFLTQVLEKPMSRPRKKNIPKSVLDQIIVLEKLAGLLTLFGLKTKDKEMANENWIKSSQNVKWIANLISLRIFEEFELPQLKSKLIEIRNESIQLFEIVNAIEFDNNKDLITNKLAKIFKMSDGLIVSFEKHYQPNTNPEGIKYYWSNDFDIHGEITEIGNKLIKL